MTALLLIWFLWSVLALGLGVVIGLSIRDADRREQPDLDESEALTERLDVLL